MKVAALDLGTNTFLCLIAEGDAANGISRVHQDLAQVVRLGQGVDKTGEFHPEALIRARACLEDFKRAIDLHKVDRVLAMATSAARDAKNGQELFRMGQDLGIPIEIIPGEDEARITYQGATSGLTDDGSTNLVVDVGGGSTELILGQGKNVLYGKSLNIGAVRLTERFISHQPISHEESDQLKSFLNIELGQVIADLKEYKIDKIIAVAGTPTAIAAIEVGGYDEKKVDGYFLSQERLAYWSAKFAELSVREKKQRFNLGGRSDIIFAGVCILAGVVEQLSMSGLMVSTKGVRYCVALEMLRG